MKYNFSAGPATLPKEVFQEASQAMLDYNGSGLSIGEIAHRGHAFKEILTNAQNAVRTLLNISQDYEILFLTGGGNMQFLMTPLNLLDIDDTAAYVDTGKWAQRAITEAKLCGEVAIVGSSEDKNYTYIPKNLKQGNYKYLHLTTNNTIRGTQFKSFPDLGCPLIGDMSSDVFSRQLDVNRFDLIFACAQKNVGIAGTTLVIIKKEALGKVDRHIPAILDYREHIKMNSVYNTAPVLPIYIAMLHLQWQIKNGGVEAFEKINKEKATLLYDTIDNSELFYSDVNVEDRSTMNAVFKIKEPQMESDFISFASANGCVGIKGHRSMGGFRVSMYNAMPMEGVEQLVQIMQDFEKQY